MKLFYRKTAYRSTAKLEDSLVESPYLFPSLVAGPRASRYAPIALPRFLLVLARQSAMAVSLSNFGSGHVVPPVTCRRRPSSAARIPGMCRFGRLRIAAAI